MVWLPDGENISKISLFVLAQLTNVTDGRTDGQTPGDGNSRAMHRIARQKLYNFEHIVELFISGIFGSFLRHLVANFFVSKDR